MIVSGRVVGLKYYKYILYYRSSYKCEMTRGENEKKAIVKKYHISEIRDKNKTLLN